MDDTATLSITDVWQAYQNMSRLLDSLPPHTRQVVECILEEGVTLDVIKMADEVPDEEYQQTGHLLPMIVGGNPDNLEGLTQLILDELEWMMKELAT